MNIKSVYGNYSVGDCCESPSCLHVLIQLQN